jgi:4-hydroxyphenylacetate 3-monooxygenase
MHQFSTKNLAKDEFMMAVAFAMARSTKIDAHLHVQGMLAELIQYTEFVRSCLRASEVDAQPNAQGFMTPAHLPLWTVRMMFPKMFIRMCEIVQILGAGGLVAVPSYAELSGPVGKDVETYFQAANADSRYRIKLFRLAFDAAVSSFSGRQQLYERYYSGDPVRLAGTLYEIYDKNPYVDRIAGLLDDLETRQDHSEQVLGFKPVLSAAE